MVGLDFKEIEQKFLVWNLNDFAGFFFFRLDPSQCGVPDKSKRCFVEQNVLLERTGPTWEQ